MAVRIRLPHDAVNALVPHTLAAPIMGASSGPLAGLTFVVKDLFDLEGRGMCRWV